MNKGKGLCIAISLTAAQAAFGQVPNLVSNGSFETGRDGWNKADALVSTDYVYAHSGTGSIVFVCTRDCLDVPGKGAYVSQLLPTVAGQAYELTFWTRNQNGTSELAVYWDGAQVGRRLVDAGPMTQVTFSGLVSSGSGTRLEIHGRAPSVGYNLSLDDVMVVQAQSAVPEAATAPMLLAGLAAVALVARRRRRDA